MSTLKSIEFSKFNNLPIIDSINILKYDVDSIRPLSKEMEDRIMQKFRLDWNYNSNAIEGNSLDYGETAAFLMHGITAKGKPLKDYLDIRGHNDAIEYLSDLMKNILEFGEKDIRSLHKMLLIEGYDNPYKGTDGVVLKRRIHIGEYKLLPNHVQTVTGEIHYYATPEDTPILMHELVEWLRNSLSDGILHPLVIASVFHHQFTSIHPFDDGNGRMSRLLTNLILMHFQYPPIVIKAEYKNDYYLTLSQADAGDFEPFIDFIGKSLVGSLELYIKGSKGEKIEDPTDLRKKILLFKKEIDGSSNKVEVKKSTESLVDIYDHSISALLNETVIVMSDFNDLFFNNSLNEIEFDGALAKWDYNKIISSNQFKDKFIESGTEKKIIIFNYKLNDFKMDQIIFSLDVNLIFKLSELTYEIYYSILDPSVLENADLRYTSQLTYRNNNIKRYYHQVISHEDNKVFANDIGESVLKVVQERHANKYDNLEDRLGAITEIWWRRVSDEPSFDEDLIEKLVSLSQISNKNNFIIIKIKASLYDLIDSDIENEIELDIFKEIIKIFNFKIEPLVSIVPV